MHALRYALVFLFGLSLLVATPAHARQEVRGAAATGVAGGGAAFVRDNNTLFLNPANLVFNERPAHVVLTLGSVHAFTGGDLLQYGYYNDYLTGGRVLTDGDKAALLDGWFGSEIRRVGVQAEVIPLALTVRPTPQWAVGLGVRMRNATQVGLNRGWLEVLLYGNGRDGSVPIDGTFRWQSTVDVTAAVSRYFPALRLAVGVAPKLVLGTEYGEGVFNSTLTTTDAAVRHAFDYQIRAAGGFSGQAAAQFNLFDGNPFADGLARPFSSIAARGVGLDAGATFMPTPALAVAISLTDVGRLTWTEDAQHLTPVNDTFVFDGLVVDFDAINDSFDGSFGDYATSVLDSLARAAYSEVHRTQGSFQTNLPTAFHVGTAWTFWRGRATLTGGMTRALNDAPGNLTTAPLFHAGGVLRLGPVPLRGGVRLGGDAMVVGMGVGLNTRRYDLNLGLAVTPYATGGARYSLALSLLTLRL